MTDVRCLARHAICFSLVASLICLTRVEGTHSASDRDIYREEKTIPLQQEFRTISHWRLAIQEPTNDYGTVPLRMCFWKDPERRSDFCRDATEALSNSVAYAFQGLKEATVITVERNGYTEPGLLVVTEHRGTQDGLLKLDVWIYDRSTDRFVNAVPAALPILTWQSEYRVLPGQADKVPGLLVVANRVWNLEGGEGLFSPHLFRVWIYRYDRGARFYRYVDDYVTKQKYKSLDDVDEIKVIDPEWDEIRRRVSKASVVK